MIKILLSEYVVSIFFQVELCNIQWCNYVFVIQLKEQIVVCIIAILDKNMDNFKVTCKIIIVMIATVKFY